MKWSSDLSSKFTNFCYYHLANNLHLLCTKISPPGVMLDCVQNFCPNLPIMLDTLMATWIFTQYGITFTVPILDTMSKFLSENCIQKLYKICVNPGWNSSWTKWTELKILQLIWCILVLLVQKGQQNGQTSQKGEQNDKSWQKASRKSSEKFIRKVIKVIQPAKKVNKYFGFQKSSANRRGSLGRAFSIVDGKFLCWCCGDLKIFHSNCHCTKNLA